MISAQHQTSWSLLRAFQRDPLALFVTLTQSYGTRVRFRMGPWTFYLLTDPDSVGEVLSHHGKGFLKGPGMDASNPLTGAGLLTQEGSPWIDQRRRMAGVFRQSNIALMIPELDAALSHLIAGPLRSGGQWDLEPLMLRLSLTMVMHTIFAEEIPDPSTLKSVGDDVEWLMRHFYHRSRSIWRFPYHLKPFNHGYHVREARLHRVIDRVNPCDRPYDTVWPHLAPHPQHYPEVLTLVIAGYETTGHAIAWALDLMSRHPDWEQAVYQESLNEASPHPSTHPITQAVLLEALRLYPPVWLLSRKPTETMELGRDHLEPGQIILISPWMTHRLADSFANPESFDPSRWLSAPPTHPYAYIPFGAGPRRCIGEHLALQEALLAISRLTRAFTFHPYGPRDVFPGMTLGARYPLWSDISPRA